MDKFKQFNLFIIKMSKIKEKYENSWMEIIHVLRDKFPESKIGLYQEAELDWPIFRPIDDQVDLFNAIKKCDFFMCHNKIDEGLYSSISDRVKTFYVPTPLPIEKIFQYRKSIEFRKERKEIVFGSSFDYRSYGLLGYLVAKDFTDYKLVQYCRSEYADDRNNKMRNCIGREFEILPRMNWFDFCKRLGESFVSMNLMLAAAAGRDAIMFAALGVPHIGNARLDAMRICFPSLAIDPLDLEGARMRLKHLLEDKMHYLNVCAIAQNQVMNNFSFKAVKEYLKRKFMDELRIQLC